MTLKEDLQELALIGADPVLFMKFRMFLEMCEDDVGNEKAALYLDAVRHIAFLSRLLGVLK